MNLSALSNFSAPSFMNKLFIFCLGCMFFTQIHAVSASDKLQFFRIGAGPTSETLYALSTAISAGISRPPGTLPCDTVGGVCGVPGLIAVSQAKSGSVENLEELRAGEVDSALVRADIANQAFNGQGPFISDGSNKNLRVIANLLPVSTHIVVRSGSVINSIKDLKGKTISLGASKSGSRLFVKSLLQAHDMNLYDLRYHYMLPGNAVDALENGKIDAAIIIGAAPIEAIKTVTDAGRFKLLSLSDEARTNLKRLYADIQDGEIDKSVYNLSKNTKTVQFSVQWVVDVEAPLELIEDITQALWQSETKDLFLRNNPGHIFPTPENSIPIGLIPLHPGALGYYKTNGLM